MGCGGPLSSTMMIAGAGMLPGADAIAGVGSSLSVNANLISAVNNFNGQGITSQFSSVVTNATGTLGSGTLTNLRTLGSDTFPALTNAIPGSVASNLSVMAPGGVFDGGLTGLVSGAATNIMGGGDLTKFSQIFNAAEGLAGQANQFINSNLNIQSIGATFGPLTGGMDSVITGGFNQVTQAFGSFGQDLGNLGSLINMGDLENLGSPSALVKQLTDVGGLVPSVSNVLKQAGLDTSQITSLVSGNLGGLTDSANKLLYEGMTNITGDDLDQIKNVLGVTTPGISNMADLLDPTKILPNSFATLTMPTPDGLRGIYDTEQGAVNTNLEKYLSTTTQNIQSINPDLITRARQGIDLSGKTNQDLVLTTADTRTVFI